MENISRIAIVALVVTKTLAKKIFRQIIFSYVEKKFFGPALYCQCPRQTRSLPWEFVDLELWETL